MFITLNEYIKIWADSPTAAELNPHFDALLNLPFHVGYIYTYTYLYFCFYFLSFNPFLGVVFTSAGYTKVVVHKPILWHIQPSI